MALHSPSPSTPTLSPLPLLPPSQGLDSFVNLTSLSLCSLGLTSLEGFPPLPKLTALTLSDNRLTGGLQHLVSAGLHSLRRLDLANNRIARLDELSPLSQLKGLHSLDLLDCPCVERTPDLHAKLFGMLDELKYLNGADKEGVGERPCARVRF